jgi:hypothetical protein
MNLIFPLLSIIFLAITNCLTTQPVHDFVTLDTTTDSDFAPLMSGDWTQRLPEDIRKYKEQILAKLHISHHEHKRSQIIGHRLKILERFQ